MAKPVSLKQFCLITVAVFAAMVVVTVVVFFAVQRAADHLPGVRPDLRPTDTAAGEESQRLASPPPP